MVTVNFSLQKICIKFSKKIDCTIKQTESNKCMKSKQHIHATDCARHFLSRKDSEMCILRIVHNSTNQYGTMNQVPILNIPGMWLVGQSRTGIAHTTIRALSKEKIQTK